MEIKGYFTSFKRISICLDHSECVYEANKYWMLENPKILGIGIQPTYCGYDIILDNYVSLVLKRQKIGRSKKLLT